MSHARKQIRDAVEVILTGLPSTGTRVYPGRAAPLVQDQGPPALAFYTYPDEIDRDESELDCVVMHRLTLEVQGYKSGGSDDDLDQIAVEVEGALFADPTLGGLAQWVYLGTQDVGRDESGARLEGVIVMQFEIGYQTQEGEPENIL